MAKHSLKILRCKHRKIFKVGLTFFLTLRMKGLIVSQVFLANIFHINVSQNSAADLCMQCTRNEIFY